jgi:hypothetical protein
MSVSFPHPYLFVQPPKLEDCPVCFTRLPTLYSGRTLLDCCGKKICWGCKYTQKCCDPEKAWLCPFCRKQHPSVHDWVKNLEKLATEYNPDAMYEVGMIYLEGSEQFGIEMDVKKGLHWLCRSANSNCGLALWKLGSMFNEGEFVEKKDTKSWEFCEQAAIAGHVVARLNLGCRDMDLRREVYNSIMDKKLAPFTTVGNSRSLHPRVVELVRLRIKSSVVGARSTNLI